MAYEMVGSRDHYIGRNRASVWSSSGLRVTWLWGKVCSRQQLGLAKGDKCTECRLQAKAVLAFGSTNPSYALSAGVGRVRWSLASRTVACTC